MTTRTNCIPLKCPCCGAKLDVYDDMQQFACGFCGTSVLVERRGGTVSLKPIEEAIRRVQVGTDKTAAELAIPRLEKELAAADGALLTEKAKLAAAKTKQASAVAGARGAPGCVIGVLLSSWIVAKIWGLQYAGGTVVLAVVVAFILFIVASRVAAKVNPADNRTVKAADAEVATLDARIATLRAQLDALTEQLRKAREIANS